MPTANQFHSAHGGEDGEAKPQEQTPVQVRALPFTYANLSKGVHSLSAQMTRGGKVYVSFPQTFIATPN